MFLNWEPITVANSLYLLWLRPTALAAPFAHS